MSSEDRSTKRDRLLGWAAGLGAITAEALGIREGASTASARVTLAAAVRDAQLQRHRPLVGQPSLYTVTRAGLRAVSLPELGLARVGPVSARHLIACAHAAAVLERRYPDHLVLGERALREHERRTGVPLASVELGSAGPSQPTTHRPDLVLLAPAGQARRPIAVEVELTVKAPRRLAQICRAWARSCHVEGVVYLAPTDVERALLRAIDTARAGDRVVVVPLDALAQPAR
jgi:hypothetical protein